MSCDNVWVGKAGCHRVHVHVNPLTYGFPNVHETLTYAQRLLVKHLETDVAKGHLDVKSCNMKGANASYERGKA